MFAVAGIVAVPVAFWLIFYLVFHASLEKLAIPLLLLEALQVIMTPLFYVAWRRYASPRRDLRALYAVCGAWCTVGVSLLFWDLSLFGVLSPTTDLRSLYETVWIGGPAVCVVAYFLAKRIYVGSGDHSI